MNITQSNAQPSINDYSNNFKHNHKGLIYAVEPLASLLTQKTSGFIIELGSNTYASPSLAQARRLLDSICSQSTWSTEFINPDYTATATNPKPDYTNQCGYLIFADKDADDVRLTVSEVIAQSKLFEKQISAGVFKAAISNHKPNSDYFNCEKPKKIRVDNNKQKNRVVIDIDVLAIRTSQGIVAIKQRYPFKQHEWVGLQELYTLGCFDGI